jgi:hypothetical protein
MTQMGARMVFENANAAITKLGYSLEHAVLTQSYLRTEIAVSTNVAQYHVPVLVNDQQNGAPFVNEKRLNLQDIFVCTEFFVGFALPAAVGNAYFPIYSFPDPNIFITGSAFMYALYNGQFQLTINNQTIVPGWDLFRHYFVPQQQTVTASKFIDQLDASANGFYPVEPNWVINGAGNIQANLILGGAISTIDANLRIIVIQRGILAQNVTPVK